MKITQRWFYLMGFAACVLLMLSALYFEHVQGLDPCPLCIFQRVAVIALGVVFLIAAIHNPLRLGRIIYTVLLVIISLGGILFAGRHVWLQNLPPEQVPACGPGLDYLLDVFPLFEALQFVFKGSGECAEEKPWGFFGFEMPGSMPGWVLAIFIIFAVVSIAMNFYRGIEKRQ